MTSTATPTSTKQANHNDLKWSVNYDSRAHVITARNANQNLVKAVKALGRIGVFSGSMDSDVEWNMNDFARIMADLATEARAIDIAMEALTEAEALRCELERQRSESR